MNTPWENASDRTKRYYMRKARQSVTAVIDEIAPCAVGPIWKSLSSSNAMREQYSISGDENDEDLDSVLLDGLAECYNAAGSWDSRRQILSIMADKVNFNTLKQWIPNLTRYRYTEAKRHCLLHGRGQQPSVPRQPRMSVSTGKIDHFIVFITSPHIIQDLPFGGKTIKLSTNEQVRVPNVIRLIIPERIVQQYQLYCQESSFTPLSRSTLLRILRVCAASVRKSLQGLDYISSTGAQAFEDLCGVVEKLGDIGQGVVWAKRQQDNLKTSKRYLKSDYKVI